jgi:DNA-directed RNA polymerase specialized sigma subunit
VAGRPTNRPRPKCCSLDALKESDRGAWFRREPAAREEPTEPEPGADDLARLQRLFSVGLTEQQHDVLCLLLLLDGRQVEVAKVLGVTDTRISQIVRGIRERAKVEGV